MNNNQLKVVAASVRSPFAIAFVHIIGLKLSQKILDPTEAKISGSLAQSFRLALPDLDRDWPIRLSYLLL